MQDQEKFRGVFLSTLAGGVTWANALIRIYAKPGTKWDLGIHGS